MSWVYLARCCRKNQFEKHLSFHNHPAIGEWPRLLEGKRPRARPSSEQCPRRAVVPPMTHRAAAVPRLPPPPLPQLLLVLLLVLQLGVTHADPDPGNEPGTRPPDTLEAMERYNAAAVLFNEANVVWGNGDLEGAARMYRESIVLYPDLGEAHLNLGNILDGRPSLYHYQRAAECSHPDRGGNRVLYANALANVGLAMQRLAVRRRERDQLRAETERGREREREYLARVRVCVVVCYHCQPCTPPS